MRVVGYNFGTVTAGSAAVLSIIYSATDKYGEGHYTADNIVLSNNSLLECKLVPGVGRSHQVQVVVAVGQDEHVSMSLDPVQTRFSYHPPALQSLLVSAGNVPQRVLTITGEHLGRSIDWEYFSGQNSQEV